MIQKIITSIHHDVSNPHRFDVISFAKFVRINVQWNYRTTKVTQLFLVRPYTRITLLGFTPNVMLTHVVAYKKIFLYTTTFRTNFHVNKNFLLTYFFQNFYKQSKISVVYISIFSFIFPPGGKYKGKYRIFSPTEYI